MNKRQVCGRKRKMGKEPNVMKGDKKRKERHGEKRKE